MSSVTTSQSQNIDEIANLTFSKSSQSMALPLPRSSKASNHFPNRPHSLPGAYELLC